METSEKKIDCEEKENIKSPQKPNWFVCFLLTFANYYFSGFLGKTLITGEKFENRFLRFINNIFFLIIRSLPVALFVSYFLITVPTWLFVFAIVLIANNLFNLVSNTNQTRNFLANQKEQKKEEEAKNHAKYYECNDRYYKNRPTTLIGDFFRCIGTVYFSFLFGKSFMSGTKIYRYRSKAAKHDIPAIIFMLLFWALVVPCFLIPVPTWLFVLAIVSAVAKLAKVFCFSYLWRQRAREDLFFCKCQGENKVHASSKQVEKKYRADVPAQFEFIDKNDVINHS